MIAATQLFTQRVAAWKSEKTSNKWFWLATVKRMDGPRCVYCGEDQKDGGTLDHLVPTFAGGVTIKQNHVLACLPCNVRKGQRDVLTFRLQLRGNSMRDDATERPPE